MLDMNQMAATPCFLFDVVIDDEGFSQGWLRQGEAAYSGNGRISFQTEPRCQIFCNQSWLADEFLSIAAG